MELWSATSPRNSRMRVEVMFDARGRPCRPGPLPWLARVAPGARRGRDIALVSEPSERSIGRIGEIAPPTSLSFPLEGAAAQMDAQDRRETSFPTRFLSVDIVIARGVARRQARAAGHPEDRNPRAGVARAAASPGLRSRPDAGDDGAPGTETSRKGRPAGGLARAGQ